MRRADATSTNNRQPRIRTLLLRSTAVAAALLGATTANAEPQDIAKPTIAISEVKAHGATLGAPRSQELRTCLESALYSTRRFDLLTRDSAKLEAVRDEQKFAASELSAGNAAPTGALDAANFLVLPTVEAFSFGRSAQAIPNIDSKYKTKDSGALRVSVQVVDSGSGAIRGTYELNAGFAGAETIANSSGGGPAESNFAKMCHDVGTQLAHKVVDTVFPTIVLKTEGSDLWINLGSEGGAHIGDQLSVYHPGSTLTDPRTGENLGTTETFIGKAKIVRANPKVSLAQLSDPKAPAAQAGDILRRGQ